MRYIRTSLLIILSLSICFSVSFADKTASKKTNTATLEVVLPKIPNGTVIPADYAFCVEDGSGKAKLGANQSPEIKWSKAPKETKSFAIIVTDSKVPSKADHVNKEGKVVSKTLPRVNFYHWVLANIPASLSSLSLGAESKGVVAKGKKAGKTDHGVRGINNYSDWFASDPKMSGQYGGYDGPCPPWNDELIHEYHFEVFALDVASLKLKDNFKAPDLHKAMKGHILAVGKSIGIYKLNASVKY